MSVKPITQVFTMRDETDIIVDLTTGQSGSGLQVLSIPTSLDTLNREVLMIQEADFDLQNTGYWASVFARTTGSIDPLVAFITGDVTITLTEVDPSVDPTALRLSSPHFIASQKLSTVAGLMVERNENPDTGSYSSVAFGDHPLFTTASATLYLSLNYHYNGNDPGTMTGANPKVAGDFRIFCQRGRADADTYAAILTGLYA